MARAANNNSPIAGVTASNIISLAKARGRMASVKVGSVTTSYGINGLEQRVSKKGSGVTTGAANYVYDEDGQLIGEYDNTGKLVNETVYLGSLPVGILTASANYTISPDHLGSPRAAHDAAGKDVWSWERLPYGNTLPIASGLTYNLRFPGQYYDAETKLHYNHHRDYDPALTGRYIQSDPIGLKGGVNTYAYALNNPVNLIDPLGLKDVLGETIQYLLPAHTAMFSSSPIGGTIEMQMEYAGQVNALRMFEADMAMTALLADMPIELSNKALCFAGNALESVGPFKQWLRIGPSYSLSLGENISMSVRWGASPRYAGQIGNPSARALNQSLRKTKLPIDSWRTNDPGHLHLWK